MLFAKISYQLSGPTTLHCDNQSAIALTWDGMYHARTKYIAIQYHFIRNAVQMREATICYYPTVTMLADLFTKALSPQRTCLLANSISLHLT